MPFIPPAGGARQVRLGAAIVRGAAVIFFAYIGFDAVSTAAQESRRTRSATCPSASSGRSPSARCSTSRSRWCSPGIVKYTQLNVPDPIAVGINAAGPALAWLRPGREDRRHRGSLVGDPRHAARPAAHLLHDVEGRPAAAGVQPRCTRSSGRRTSRASSPVPGGDGVRGSAADRAPGRAGLHRDAARLRDRLRAASWCCAYTDPDAGPAVPHAAGAVRADCSASWPVST